MNLMSSSLTRQTQLVSRLFSKSHTQWRVIVVILGPAVSLFEENYFALMKKALKPGGIVCSQGSNFWIDTKHVKETLDACGRQFPKVSYATAMVPSYPCGSIGFFLGAMDAKQKLEEPSHCYSLEEVDRLGFRYYTSDVHKAAFVLPRFACKALGLWTNDCHCRHESILERNMQIKKYFSNSFFSVVSFHS